MEFIIVAVVVGVAVVAGGLLFMRSRTADNDTDEPIQ